MDLEEFSRWYGDKHGCVSLVVCCFGIPTNVINITVLTRKHMHTPINMILTWIALFDIVTMVSYVLFVIHFYIEYPTNSLSPEKNSLGWMRFLLFHSNLSSTTHTISIWLGVALAIFRYNHIHSPESGSLTDMRRIIRCRIVVFVIMVGSGLLLIPNYLSAKLEPWVKNGTVVEDIFIIEDFRLGTPQVKPAVFINLIIYSVVAKLIPCVLMLVFGGLLLKTLDSHVRVNRKKLSKLGVVLGRQMNTTRTTTMLLVVMVLFLVTELPQGILVLMCLSSETFFSNVYIPLGDVMDIVALINNSINFVLYCSMSMEFRKTLKNLLCICKAKSKGPQKLPSATELATELNNKCLIKQPNGVATLASTDVTTDDMQTGSNMTGSDGMGCIVEIIGSEKERETVKKKNGLSIINKGIIYEKVSLEDSSGDDIFSDGGEENSEKIPLARTKMDTC